MSITQAVNDYYSALSSNFEPTKPITTWKLGFESKLATLPGVTAMLVVDKGSLDRISTQSQIAYIECALFIQNLKSATQHSDLLQFTDDFVNLTNSQPHMGGVQEIEITGWDFSISDDGINAGLLVIELTLTARI